MGTPEKYASFQTGRTNISGLHGRMRPYGPGVRAHTSWAYAPTQNGCMRPYRMDAGLSATPENGQDLRSQSEGKSFLCRSCARHNSGYKKMLKYSSLSSIIVMETGDHFKNEEIEVVNINILYNFFFKQ